MQVERFASEEHTGTFALTLANTEGPLLEILQSARLKTRVALLDELTTIESYDRRFRLGGDVQGLDSAAREAVQATSSTTGIARSSRSERFRRTPTRGSATRSSTVWVSSSPRSAPYVSDLDWTDINDFDSILGLLEPLGRAVAKIHCVSDVDSDQTLIDTSTDKAIAAALRGEAGGVRGFRRRVRPTVRRRRS